MLQPELMPFYFTGAKNLPTDAFIVPPAIDSLVSDVTAERRTGYFAIPVLVKYGALGRQLHIGAGPQIGFLTSGTDKIQGTINRQITIEEDNEDRLNSTDAGIVFNLSYKLQPSFGTGINVRYFLGHHLKS